MTIRIDSKTGLKTFNTRATNINTRASSQGYAVVEEESLKTLPESSQNAEYNDAAKQKYRDYKDVRSGVADYISLNGEFGHYLEDVYSSEIVDRETLDDECEVLVIGAGFSGLMLWHKLQQAGFQDVRFCEKGGDVGGTWYWNRYPGVACDVEAYSYLPLLEEMEYFPQTKFASGFEIYEYCQKIAKKYKFYDRCLFHTTVEKTLWDESLDRWRVITDRGDEMKARFVILANGILTTPKLARIEGMNSFAGDSFHTSRWNHKIDLQNKRIGIIGTGATAVQAVPELAKIASELFVFQRTPSTIDVRDQRKTTAEEIAQWSQEENWAKKRRERFSKISAGRTALQGNDDYLSGKIDQANKKKNNRPVLTKEEILSKQLQSNFRLMEQIRGRVDSIVKDKITAEALKPYYPYGCKRPTFHDEYLPTFNLPHVKLVDTAPMGVNRITPKGIIHDDKEYKLDVIVYATGFQWMATSSFNMICGRNSQSLYEKWQSGGTKTFLGIHSRGFPNLFIMTGPQGGGGAFNFTETIDEHADYIVWMLKTLRERDIDVVDVKQSFENDYALHCKESDKASRPLRDCASYYNGEGEAEPGSLAYYGGDGWKRYRDEAQASLEPYEFVDGKKNNCVE